MDNCFVLIRTHQHGIAPGDRTLLRSSYYRPRRLLPKRVQKHSVKHQLHGDGVHWESTVTIVQCRYETVLYNSPFPNSFKPLFQSEASFKAIDMKITFYSHANKTRINNEKFSLSLVFKVRVFQTRKWSIELFGCGRATKHLLQF